MKKHYVHATQTNMLLIHNGNKDKKNGGDTTTAKPINNIFDKYSQKGKVNKAKRKP